MTLQETRPCQTRPCQTRPCQTRTHQTRPRPVDVDELKQAWHAVISGEYRNRRTGTVVRRPPDTGEPATAWNPEPGERVIPVLGVAGQVGATTTALAIAAARPTSLSARVVECGPPSTSGLAAASTAELGTHESGWCQGNRGQVRLERPARGFVTPEHTPMPLESGGAAGQLTLLDVAWDPGQVFGTDSWLVGALHTASEVVVVTTATVPGFRRLEMVLELTEQLLATVRVAVIGPKRWPKPVTTSAGTRTRTLLAADGRVVRLPHDRHLAVTGLDSRPLPDRLLNAAGGLFDQPPAATDQRLEELRP